MKNQKYHSILFKLRLVLLVPFAFFMLAIIFILGIQYRKSAANDIISQLKYEDEIIAQSLEARIQNTKMSANTMIIQLNNLLEDEDLNEEGYPGISMSTQRKVYSCMVNTFTTFYDAEQIMVVWNNGVTWYQNWMENYSMQKDGEPLIDEMKELGINKTGRWLLTIQSDSQIKGTGYYFAKQYSDIQTGKELGYVVLKTKGVFDSIESVNPGRLFYLFDPYGQLIFTSDEVTAKQYLVKAELGEGKAYSEGLKMELQRRQSNSRQTINTRALDKRWILVSVTDMNQALRGLHTTIACILMMSSLIAVIIFMAINNVIVRMIMPIQTLSNHMTDFSDELPAPIDMEKRNDEIGTLVMHFNKMTERNRELVMLLLEEKKQQEQLKLSLLQSQIKPHFLYNTLDTIYCLVLMGKNEEGSRMTKLLSDYYRHVLNNGLDWVFLLEEVKYTTNYLQIQSIRYRDILEFEVSVDAEVENIRIPKLTLQPLVENALYHGIKPLEKKGHIKIYITQEKEVICIRIQDDGVGLSKEKFTEVLRNESSSLDGFGLRNVVSRLHLYFGDRCIIYLEDCAYGTTIAIRIEISEEIL